MWRHQLEKVSVGKALNLCWLLCVYLSMYNTHPFYLHPIPPPPSGFHCLLRCKSHLYRCIWLLSLGQRPRGNSLWLSWLGLAWPPNKAEGSKFLNAAPALQIQLGCRYTTNSSWQPQIAFGHERAVPDKPSDCHCDCDGDWARKEWRKEREGGTAGAVYYVARVNCSVSAQRSGVWPCPK